MCHCYVALCLSFSLNSMQFSLVRWQSESTSLPKRALSLKHQESIRASMIHIIHCLQEAYSHVQRGKNFMHMTFSCIVQSTFSMLFYDNMRILLYASMHRRHFVSTHHSIRHSFLSIGISITPPAFQRIHLVPCICFFSLPLFFLPTRYSAKILVVVVCLSCWAD